MNTNFINEHLVLEILTQHYGEPKFIIGPWDGFNTEKVPKFKFQIENDYGNFEWVLTEQGFQFNFDPNFDPGMTLNDFVINLSSFAVTTKQVAMLLKGYTLPAKNFPVEETDILHQQIYQLKMEGVLPMAIPVRYTYHTHMTPYEDWKEYRKVNPILYKQAIKNSLQCKTWVPNPKELRIILCSSYFLVSGVFKEHDAELIPHSMIFKDLV
jgi:hypothetical protein